MSRKQGSRHVIASSVVVPVLEVLRELGFDPPAAPSATDGVVAGDVADRMIDHAAHVLANPALGLTLAERLPIGAFGPIDYGLVTASSLGEGLGRVVHYYGVATQRIRLSLIDAPPRCTLALERLPPLTHSRHWIEMSVALAVVRVRQALGPQFALEALSFAHEEPKDRRPHDAFFGVKVTFAAPRDELVFASELLSLPLRTAAAALAVSLERTLSSLRPPDDGDDELVRRVREVMGRLLDEAEVGLGPVVDELGLPRRTVQRELQRRGTSHQRILDELRRARALRLLEDEHHTVAEVSDALGFSEPSAFFRAFRRWTGRPPRG